MHSRPTQEIICDYRDIEPLCTLIEILNKYLEGPASSICELIFLEKFPTSKTLHPNDRYSPRQIIEIMLEKHKYIEDKICGHSNMFEALVFKYNIGTKACEFKFSNNMEFYADVYTICYLYHKIIRYNFQTIAVEKVMTLMINKYEINTSTEVNLDPKTITFFRIAHSYPSVTLDMFDLDFERYSIFLSLKFPDFNIPRVMFSPIIPAILPNLSNPPIAILIAIFLKLDDASKCDGVPKILLNVIYNRVLTPYVHTLFPEDLKLDLCKRWEIVESKENTYEYSSSFIACRETAKNMISELRPEDPNLEKILSDI